MKRSSLLVRMVISIFLVFLILPALVGTFYYQLSSIAIEATIEVIAKRPLAKLATYSVLYQKLEPPLPV